jgi:hypothetical protein
MGAWLARIGYYIGPMILEFFWGKVKRWLDARNARKEQAEKDKATAEKYSAVVDNPNSTREERKDAEDSMLNGD